MPTAKITKAVATTALPKAKRYRIHDTSLKGFGLEVHPTGRKVFLYRYRTRDARERRVSIGRFGTITAEKAREIAARWAVEVAAGRDPVKTKAAARKAPTMNDLADRYLTEWAVHKKPSGRQTDAENLQRHVRPALGRKRVTDVTRADVVALHAKIGSRTRRVEDPETGKRSPKRTTGAANRVVALLSKMFNLAEEWEWRDLGTNPCRHIRKFPERPRTRHLSAEEYGKLFKVLDAIPSDPLTSSGLLATARIVRLLVFTGCRRGEIVKRRWSDVDWHGEDLVLDDSKTGAGRVALSSYALDVLRSMPRGLGNAWLFPHRDNPSRHMTGRSVSYYWGVICRKAGLRGVTIHDLRHSIASVAAREGFSLPYIGAALRHRHASTTQRYVHFTTDAARSVVAAAGEAISRAGSAR